MTEMTFNKRGLDDNISVQIKQAVIQIIASIMSMLEFLVVTVSGSISHFGDARDLMVVPIKMTVTIMFWVGVPMFFYGVSHLLWLLVKIYRRKK